MTTVTLLFPEILLVAAAVAVYTAGAFLPWRAVWRWVALAATAAAAAALWEMPGSPATGDPLVADGMALYGRWLSLGAGALLVLLAWRPDAEEDTPEYFGSLLLLVAGLMLVAGAADLVILFVGLELVSIPTYILLYLGRRDAASQEATAKYFYLSVLASALLLYGLSFLYGMAGTTDLQLLGERVRGAAFTSSTFVPLAKVALIFVLAGLGFRVAAVPFHFYAPDVYQGTTHANAGLLSVAPKIAGLLALVRILAAAWPAVQADGWVIVLVLAVLTMTLGNVMALWQDNLRRLMAYSAIAHAGYLLVGLAVFLVAGPAGTGEWDGVAGILFYLVVYAAATIGTFAALASLGDGDRQVEKIDQLAGLPWSGGPRQILLAWAIAAFMFSLAGVPPLAGFWGKFALFASALSTGRFPVGVAPWFIALSVISVLNSVVSAAYYLRIVSVMFFRPAQTAIRTKEGAGGMLAAAIACLVLVVSIGVRPGPWIDSAQRARPEVAATTHPAALTQTTQATIHHASLGNSE